MRKLITVAESENIFAQITSPYPLKIKVANCVLHIGRGSFGALSRVRLFYFDSIDKVEDVLIIGDFCEIADDAQIFIGGGHLFNGKIRNTLSNSRVVRDEIFQSNSKSVSTTFSSPTSIGHNVVICSRAIIQCGSIIGTNSVVAGGAVVTGDFTRNSLIGGVPAKKITSLRESEPWWEYDYDSIIDCYLGRNPNQRKTHNKRVTLNLVGTLNRLGAINSLNLVGATIDEEYVGFDSFSQDQRSYFTQKISDNKVLVDDNVFDL